MQGRQRKRVKKRSEGLSQSSGNCLDLRRLDRLMPYSAHPWHGLRAGGRESILFIPVELPSQLCALCVFPTSPKMGESHTFPWIYFCLELALPHLISWGSYWKSKVKLCPPVYLPYRFRHKALMPQGSPGHLAASPKEGCILLNSHPHSVHCCHWW